MLAYSRKLLLFCHRTIFDITVEKKSAKIQYPSPVFSIKYSDRRHSSVEKKKERAISTDWHLVWSFENSDVNAKSALYPS